MAYHKIDIRKINRIIVAIPDRLGDTIFHTPFFKLLKTINPGIKIDVIAPTHLSASVLHNNPRINKIFLVPMEDLELIKNNYDLAIDLNGSKISKVAIKHIEAEKITLLCVFNDQIHTAEQSLQFFAKAFDYDISNFDRSYELYPQQSNFAHIQSLLQQNGVDLKKNKLIVFHMGCHGLAKKRRCIWKSISHERAWPVRNFIKLATELKKVNKDIRIILTGSKEEIKLVNIFCKKQPDSISLINQTSVLDLAALMSFLNLVICNDTGLAHVACSSKVPVIVLYLKHAFTMINLYCKHPDKIALGGNSEHTIPVSEVLKKAIPFIS